ncbi:hypothetical protein [Streptomyces sp. NPDC049040]
MPVTSDDGGRGTMEKVVVNSDPQSTEQDEALITVGVTVSF